MIKQKNTVINDAVEYKNYRAIERSERYADNVASGLNTMTQKAAVQMNDRSVTGRDVVLIFITSQDLNVVFNACNTHDRADPWLSMHYISNPIESVIKANAALPTDNIKEL